MAQLSETALIEKVLEIHHRLCVAYQCPVAYFHSLDPLSELVSSLLSHRTRNADSGRAFKALRGGLSGLGGRPRRADGGHRSRRSQASRGRSRRRRESSRSCAASPSGAAASCRSTSSPTWR